MRFLQARRRMPCASAPPPQAPQSPRSGSSPPIDFSPRFLYVPHIGTGVEGYLVEENGAMMKETNMGDTSGPGFKLSANIFVCLLLLIFLGACQGIRPVPGGLPEEGRLRARLQEFHRALGDNDIAAWYALTSPGIRDRVTFEQFKKNLRWDENADRRSKTKTQAELAKRCSCVQERFLRCVAVVNVSIEKPGGGSSQEKPLETWEFADGEWYWAYMGPDTGGRCPGER